MPEKNIEEPEKWVVPSAEQRHSTIYSQSASAAVKTLNAVTCKRVTKVRPQDPSCVAWHRTQMRSPTLSTSTDVKKIPADALGTR